MKLQFSAEQRSVCEQSAIPDSILQDGILTMRTDLLVKELIEQRLSGVKPQISARYFHENLSGMIVGLCRILRERIKCNICALSGGVFQNTLLLEIVSTLLESEGFVVLKHQLIPPNDGGIALGQAAAAMRKLNS